MRWRRAARPARDRQTANRSGQDSRAMSAMAYVGLGSNLSHPRRQVARALAAIARLPRSRIVRVSPNYATAPIASMFPQPDFVNAVVALRTSLSPRPLLRRLQAIERRH